MSQASGTVVESAGVLMASASFVFHDDTILTPWRTYKVITMVDPQAGGAWTPALLDTTQVGFGNAADVAPNPQCSWLWLAVEVVNPSGGGGPFGPRFPRPVIVSQAVQRASRW